MTAGTQVLIVFLPLWLLIGVVWAFLDTELGGALAPEGMTLLGRTTFFFLFALWPLKAGAWFSLHRHQGKKTTPMAIFSLESLVPFAFAVAANVVLAGLVGLFIDWCLTSLILGASAAAPWPFIQGPAAVKSIMRLYPAMCLGGILTAHRYGFAPFAALDGNLGLFEAIDKGRAQASGVRLEILFLAGLMFFPASIGFLLGAVTGGDKFPGNIVGHVVYAVCFAYAGAVWAQAFRQTIDLDDLEQGNEPAVKARARAHI